MNAIRWIFFLTLSILLITSCNNASAQFGHDPVGAAGALQARALSLVGEVERPA